MTDLAQAAFAASLADFQAAALNIASDAIVTPALPLAMPDRNLFLKAECLQPLGSFKIRAAANAIGNATKAQLANGVVTASAGNFGQGIAQAAMARGLAVKVFVPETSAKIKIDALRNMGAEVELVTFADLWQIIMTRETGANGFFIHPVAELAVVMGNGSIGLEIAAQVPDVDTIVVPFGGGGLISGIALAMRALGRRVRIVACEIESATPLSAAKRAGKPVEVARGQSWIDGIGSTGVLPDMWPLLDQLVDDVIVVSHDQAAEALRMLATRAHLVAEGAGAVALAAALHPSLAGRNVVAVISGGNIDAGVYGKILQGQPV
ncbi:MAG: pyridoxal-phosphate dependent enzyme [Alphaproteobacteria bacterium]|nr:pyridoxal-phosphate dependent enzyme [Alphaproteobacteria bacterium]